MVIILRTLPSVFMALRILEKPVCLLDIVPVPQGFQSVISLWARVNGEPFLFVFRELHPSLQAARGFLGSQEAAVRETRPETVILPGSPAGEISHSVLSRLLGSPEPALEDPAGQQPRRFQEEPATDTEEPSLAPGEREELEKAIKEETRRVLGE